MAEKNGSKSVMGNLPSTRPARIGRRRESGDGEPAQARASATPAKPKPKAKPAAAKAKPVAAKAKLVAAQPASQRPRAVRSGSPALKAAKDKQPPRRPAPPSPPRGTELVTTAVQAAGELAQIGFTLGGQAVKRAVRRLPKP
jgi:hypothetical protein